MEVNHKDTEELVKSERFTWTKGDLKVISGTEVTQKPKTWRNESWRNTKQTHRRPHQ